LLKSIDLNFTLRQGLVSISLAFCGFAISAGTMHVIVDISMEVYVEAYLALKFIGYREWKRVT